MNQKNPRVMPEPIMRSFTSNTVMGSLVFSLERQDEEDRYAHLYVPGQEELLGFFIPPFQRPPVWSVEQSIAFIENAWRGVHLGTFIVNENAAFDQKTQRFHYTDRWLIDGQQRLRAVDAYLRNVFPIFGYYWGDLPGPDRARFGNLPFAKSVIHEGDENKLRFLYDCLNFGGVPHTEDQRATLRDSADPQAPSSSYS